MSRVDIGLKPRDRLLVVTNLPWPED